MNFNFSDQRKISTSFNVLYLWFFLQVILLLLLISFSSGFFIVVVGSRRPDLCCRSWDMSATLTMGNKSMWALILSAANRLFLRQATLMNPSPAVERTAGLSFQEQSSWESLSSQCWIHYCNDGYRNFLKVMKLFQSDSSLCIGLKKILLKECKCLICCLAVRVRQGYWGPVLYWWKRETTFSADAQHM